MKKNTLKCVINWIIIGLAAVTLIWGIGVSSVYLGRQFVGSAQTTVSYDSTYKIAKDGRTIVASTVTIAEGEDYLYVKSDDVNVINSYEKRVRDVKALKIAVTAAEKNLDKAIEDNLGDAIIRTRELAVQTAENAYNAAKISFNQTNAGYFQNASSTFFGTYFPVVIFLGIAFLVNQKVEYKVDFKKKTKEETK